jgi:hypothetical protein
LYKGQFWALCITPLAVATLLFGLRLSEKLPHRRAPLFLGLMLLTLLAARLPLFCYDAINPDEAFLLSSAMRISADPVPYRAADSGTSGPFNIYVLAIPAWFGSPLTYASARLTAILLMFGALALLWLALRRFLGQTLAVLAVMPAFCFVAYAPEGDFTHASSEHFPIFLCGVACYLLARDYKAGPQSSPASNAALGAVAAGMVFAKLQALPIAAALLLLSAATAWRKWRRWTAIAALCGGAAVVPAIFLSVFFRYGVLREFWFSYFGRNLAYANVSDLTAMGRLVQAWFLLQRKSLMRWYAFGVFPVWLAGLVAGAAAVRSRSTSPSRSWLGTAPARDAAALTSGAAILLLAAVATVAGPGKPFPHYLLFLVVPGSLVTASSMLWVRILLRDRAGEWPGRLAAVCFLVIACFLPTFLTHRWDSSYEEKNGYGLVWSMSRFDPTIPLVTTIQRYAAPGENLAVWGWRSELNVASQRMPGTRFADSILQIDESPHRSYFRELYLADFLQSRPAVFVDAVGPGAFHYDDRTQAGYETFDGLQELVTRYYQQVADISGARVFVRADRFH